MLRSGKRSSGTWEGLTNQSSHLFPIRPTSLPHRKGERDRGVMIPLLLWLPALLHLQPSDAAPEELNGFLGGSVTFPLDIPAGQQVESVSWTSKGAVATAIPGEPGNPPSIIAPTQRYKGRLTVTANYTLTISNLNREDAGTYRADVNTAETTTVTQFSLHVWEQLVKPSVMVKSMISENGTCIVTLTCSLPMGRDNVTFSWTPLGRGMTVSSSGSILSISWRPGDPPQDYTCTATYFFSKSSHIITADKIFCPGTMKESTPNWTIVIVVVIVLGAAAIGGGVVVGRRQMKKRQGTAA